MIGKPILAQPRDEERRILPLFVKKSEVKKKGVDLENLVPILRFYQIDSNQYFKDLNNPEKSGTVFRGTDLSKLDPENKIKPKGYYRLANVTVND